RLPCDHERGRRTAGAPAVRGAGRVAPPRGGRRSRSRRHLLDPAPYRGSRRATPDRRAESSFIPEPGVIASRRALARLSPPAGAAAGRVLRRSPLAILGRYVPLPPSVRESIERAAGADEAAELAGRQIAFALLGALARIVLAKGLAPLAALPLF